MDSSLSIYFLVKQHIWDIYDNMFWAPLWYIICTAHPLSQCILPFNSVAETNMSFVSVIWVEHSKVLWDWGCESCVWIVWQYLIGFFLVLFSSFELHIIWLNRLSTSILFDWTVPVAVHWLNSFSNCIEFDWTVYLVICYLLNRSQPHSSSFCKFLSDEVETVFWERKAKC